jgi:hypothetical protein
MSEIFTEVASIDYPILDADAHVNEPPDLWQSRVPVRLRERAPKVLHTDKGDVWSFDDGKRRGALGLTAAAGLSYVQLRRGLATTPSGGGFDCGALADLDADGIWAGPLSQRDAGRRGRGDDRELQLACGAYNEWLAGSAPPGADGSPDRPSSRPPASTTRLASSAGASIRTARRPVAAYRTAPSAIPARPTIHSGIGAAGAGALGVHIRQLHRERAGAGSSSVHHPVHGGRGRKAGAQTIPVVARCYRGCRSAFPRLRFLLVEANIGGYRPCWSSWRHVPALPLVQRSGRA